MLCFTNRAPQETHIWLQKAEMSGTKHFYWVLLYAIWSFACFIFIMFFIYVKWSLKLLMTSFYFVQTTIHTGNHCKMSSIPAFSDPEPYFTVKSQYFAKSSMRSSLLLFIEGEWGKFYATKFFVRRELLIFEGIKRTQFLTCKTLQFYFLG